MKNRLPWPLFVCIVGIGLLGIDCSSRPKNPETAETVETLGRHYRQSHDYYSLARLLPHLDLRRRRREEIERLLGPPVYSPTPSQSYYTTDKEVAVACPEGSMPEEDICVTKDGKQVDPERSFPIILVVQYLESKDQPRPEDTLDSFSFGPVGE
ncbi:MAG: hypothetical protein EHM61_21800 [Acidobacteria bacterium]|nr:MAG: hypothetical protein EHM61_21800 [Acidobacteriota bacterium]